MEVSLEMLTEIVNDASGFTREDPKVYTTSGVILLLARIGAKIHANHEQQGGLWLTEIKVGRVIFLHSSRERLIH